MKTLIGYVERSRARRWQINRKLEGGCLYCPEPAVPGLRFCERHRRASNASGVRRHRRRAARYAAERRCVSCGGASTSPASVKYPLCARHREMQRVRNQRAREKRAGKRYVA